MTKRYEASTGDLDRVLAYAEPDEVDRLREVWVLAADAEPVPMVNPRAVDDLRRALQGASARHVASERPKLRLVSTRVWVPVAASLALLLAVGAYFWFQPVVRAARPGTQLAVTLPDGSEIMLNSGTTVRYQRRFGRERAVELQGEAFFDVQHDGRPFIVHTFNAQIAVLGTRFSVRAWPGSMAPSTTVALESGRVALSTPGNAADVVEVEPGEAWQVTTGIRQTGAVDDNSVEQAMAWRQGDFVFRDEWLGVIVEDLERHFRTHVALEPVTLRERRITLAARSPANAEAVLRDVCAALGLRYRETASGYEVFAP